MSELKFSSSSSCPPPAEPSKEQYQSIGSQIAEGMGIQACNNSAWNVQGSASLGGMIPFGPKLSINASGSSSVGCEQIQIIANKIHTANNNINCILNSTEAKTNTNIKQVNNIEIEVGGDLKTDCKNVSFTQNIDANVDINTNFSDKVKNDIANEAKNAVKGAVEAIQESKSGFGATPQGQKFVQETNQKIENMEFKQTVNNILNEIKISEEGNNNVKIKVGGNFTLSGDNCTFDQNIVKNIIIKNVINNTFEQVFKNISENFQEFKSKSEQINKSEGMPDIFKNEWIMYIIVGVFIVAIIYLFYKYVFSTKHKNPEESLTSSPVSSQASSIGSSFSSPFSSPFSSLSSSISKTIPKIK